MVTIVSSNYLAHARVLCRSIRRVHPGISLFVALVDRAELAPLQLDEPFELITLDQLNISDLEGFLAQYSVLEANTAVKPFVLQRLLGRGYGRVVYLDPDIWVKAPLDAVWKALESSSLVLTPHMRDPFHDAQHPQDLDILRSGTFNLGFIGVAEGKATDRLLEWWAERMEHDCVVDLENGLFVDQKWMDLAVGFISNVTILRDATYNVAYWNLHERTLAGAVGGHRVDGAPLVFFHFSGYDPLQPGRLSKHQTRHDLADSPALRALCDDYAAALRDEGLETARAAPYAFGALSNGVRLGHRLRRLIRRLRKDEIPHPPISEADEFCRFLFTQNSTVCGFAVAPIVQLLLDERSDVRAAFPNAGRSPTDKGFLHWFATQAHEHGLEALHERFAKFLTRGSAFDYVRHVYDARPDLEEAYPEAFTSLAGLREFREWLLEHSQSETEITAEDIEQFLDGGFSGFHAVVAYYFSAPELQTAFPLALLPANRDFVDWMLAHCHRTDISVARVRWFEARIAELSPSERLLLTALRNHSVRSRFPLGATVFGWPELASWASSRLREAGVDVRFDDEIPSAVSILGQVEALQLAAHVPPSETMGLRSPAAVSAVVDRATRGISLTLPKSASDSLAEALQNYRPKRGVNVAGYFGYTAGLGISVRSLVKTLDAAQIPHHDISLPVPPSTMTAGYDSTSLNEYFREHRPDYDVAITVANADVFDVARSYLGPRYELGRKHIGYWVWETTRLPGQWAPAAEGLSAIWTPSEFSKLAIQRALPNGPPVSVIPHVIDLDVAEPERDVDQPVRLPEDRTLFGCFVDARSVLERKNPAALLRAFRKAFRNDDRVTLVLKVNHAASAPRAMRRLEALADGLPVIWLRDQKLEPAQMRALLAKVDVYASLHRAEGFGLVLAEAMALGKPVVATGFSGNMQFMDAQTARLVDFELVTTDRAYGPYPRGTEWAEPDVDHAAVLLRALHVDTRLREEIGAKARDAVRRALAPATVARTVSKALAWETAADTTPGSGSDAARTAAG